MKKLVTILMFSTLALNSLIAKPSAFNHAKLLKLNFDESVKIKLLLGNKTYELQSYNLNYFRPEKMKEDVNSNNVFNNNIFNSMYQKSMINMTLRASKIDQELLNWILSSEQQAKDGQIIVTEAESGKVLKTITFTGLNTATYIENNNTNSFGNGNQYTNFALFYKTISIKS